MKIKVLCYAAAATTAIAGILHLILLQTQWDLTSIRYIFHSSRNSTAILGTPNNKRWGLPWYCLGIAGTIVLVILFLITRMPDNPMTGRAGPIMPMAIAIEVFQAAFIGLTAAIIVYEIRRKGLSSKTASETA
jgi:hypothetical protein